MLAGHGGSEVARDTLCALDAEGRPVAVGWARVPPGVRHQYRGLLLGAVHPEQRRRGLGGYLLAWTEARARDLLAALPEDRRKVVRIEVPGSRDDAVALYERRGFALQHTELEMARDLREPIPTAPLPAGLRLLEWAPERARLFYETCADAFSDRPGSGMWTHDEWVSGFSSGDTFRADLSWLAVVGPEDPHAAEDGGSAETAGFIMCDVRPAPPGPPAAAAERSNSAPPQQVARKGGIRQVGVRPGWRGRGVATALLCAAMRAFRHEGVERAVLDVNVNNPRALRVYERLGFVVTGRFSAFTKPVPASSHVGGVVASGES